MNRKYAVATLTCLLIACSSAAAQITSTNSISLQAALSGVPDGKVNLAVKFYDAETGGNQVGSTIPLNNVTVTGGIVSVPLSPVDPAIFNGSTRYMGISVNAGQELQPRTLVTGVPYAIMSDSVRLLGATTLRIQPGKTSPDAGIVSFGDGSGWTLYFTRRLDKGGENTHTFDDRGNQWMAGELSCKSLLIRGADLAERFDVGAAPCRDGLTAVTEPKPGLVVSIDPEHPGRLRVSSSPYDTKVAGIISGANNLAAGVILGKGNDQPGIDGAHAVAMTGRVWVYADESGGVITPGDRLTTSGSKPGHAMKVADSASADGAVIGKAMTGVDASSGMVLVLVNLQ